MDEAPGVVVVVPVLRRPHRVAPFLETLEAATPEPHRVLFVGTDGDHAELDAIAAAGGEFFTLPWDRGDYARKINTAYKRTTEPFLFLAADDLVPRTGWLSATLARMADPLIGVVGTQDLGSPRVKAGTHSTHSLIRRDYIEEHGTIDQRRHVLHEGYWHEYCDDELVETAKYRGAWVFAGDAIVEHLHPCWGKGEMDDIYAEQATRMKVGRRLYFRRRHMWGR